LKGTFGHVWGCRQPKLTALEGRRPPCVRSTECTSGVIAVGTLRAYDLCVVIAFVAKLEREVVVAANLFRNRTELGEADAETGQPACAVAHLLPVRLPPRVAVLLEHVEDLGLRHRTNLLSTDPRHARAAADVNANRRRRPASPQRLR